MTGRREVRVTDSFFEELDLQLSPERGDSGEPSATDFLVVDLPTIVEVFATEYDALPGAVAGLDAVRMFIGTGTLARSFVVYGVETSDGAVELGRHRAATLNSRPPCTAGQFAVEFQREWRSGSRSAEVPVLSSAAVRRRRPPRPSRARSLGRRSHRWFAD